MEQDTIYQRLQLLVVQLQSHQHKWKIGVCESLFFQILLIKSILCWNQINIYNNIHMCNSKYWRGKKDVENISWTYTVVY